MELLARSVNRLRKKQLAKAFSLFQFKHKLYRYEKRIKEDKERLNSTFNEALAGKERELNGFSKKIIELTNIIGTSKTKENEFIVKLKQKDKIISQLEAEKYDLMKTKKINPNENYDDRNLEFRV